jgi:hypothetical protein
MAGTSRTPRFRIRTRLARLGAIGVIAALAMIMTPATASAAPTVTPIVDCYRTNSDGSFWVVLGYKNTGVSRNIARGPSNQVYPSRLQGQQPAGFNSGTVHGAWTVRLTYSEIFQQNARWELDGYTLRYSQYVQYATECPPTTQLPADGNGLGTVMALGGAGVVGAALIYGSRRRIKRATAAAVPTDA